MRHTPTRSQGVVLRFVVLLVAVAALHSEGMASFSQSQTTRTVALTFDDLPYVPIDSINDIRDADRATTELLRILRVHKAPAVAFVTEGRLDVQGETDARIALLKRWADAGIVLGNHTYSHADFNELTVDQFQQEIIRGEVVTRRLMESRQPYQLYFRHPFTHTGNSIEKKQAIEAFLAERRYRVTPHTIDPADYVFDVPYVRAKRSGDTNTSGRVASAYVEFTLAATAFAEEVAPKVFGRDIPHTLLLHANEINADCLDEMLGRFKARGYRFITLDEAMRDSAYQTPDTFVTKAGPTWLWRWMKSKGMSVSFKGDPEPPAWVWEAYRNR